LRPSDHLPGTDDGGSTSAWVALRLGPNLQFRVREALRELEVEEFLPTYTEEVHWSDRTKTVERVFFQGYIFAKFDVATKHAVLGIRGVIGETGSISAMEMDNFRRAVESKSAVLPCAHVAGEKVIISRGPLAGLCGVVTRTNGATRLVVTIEILRRAVSVQIDAADVECT
jgi:transcription antitermination factor NusG